MTRQSRRNSPLRHFVPHLLASIKKRLFCTALRPNSIMTVYHLKMEGAVRDAFMCGRVGASAREDATCREVCCGPRNYYHYRMMWNQHSYLPTSSCRSKFCYSSPVLLAFRNGLKRHSLLTNHRLYYLVVFEISFIICVVVEKIRSTNPKEL